MSIIRDLAPGTTVKVLENGVAADFVIAQHNYEKELNGKGKTLLIRTKLLDEGAGFGNGKKDCSWENEPTLRNWLNETYAGKLSEDTLSAIAEVTIPYSWGDGETGKLAGQKFFVPRCEDFPIVNSYYCADHFFEGQGRFFEDSLSGGRADSTTGSGNGNWDVWNVWKYVFVTRDTKNVKNDDDVTGEVLGVLVHRGKGAQAGNPGYIDTAWSHGSAASSTADNVLVCMCVNETATVTDAGTLSGNSAPEIQSNYFGRSGSFGRWKGFGFAYAVSDAEGDSVTVTEKIDGVVLRSFPIFQNGTFRFSVADDILNSWDYVTEHTLTVEAFDGQTTTRKSCKVHRIRLAGYVVYCGKIKGTADGQSYYWTERNVLHNPANETDPVLLEPELTLEGNEYGSFTFTIPVSNPYYDKLDMNRTVISVEEDGYEIFLGYITEMNKTFELDMEVTCEGELGWLQDRECEVDEKRYTTEELLKLALTVDDDRPIIYITMNGKLPEVHTERCGFHSEGKIFLPGSVTVEKDDEDEDKETKTVSDCWSVLKSSLVEKYGGFLRLRKEIKMVDGVKVYTRYLDYLQLKDFDEKTGQAVRLGDNLLDLSYYLKKNQLVNVVTAIGWATSGWWFWESTERITATATNEASIRKYGTVQKYIVVEGTGSTTESLQAKANEELKKYTQAFAASLEVNAADLCDVGVDTERLGFLKMTYVESEPHGIANWLPCTKEVIPLDAPEEKTFTLGTTTQKLTSMQAANFGTAGKAWNAIQSTIGYVKK